MISGISTKQSSLTGGIPFPVTLPKASDDMNADLMTDEQLHAKLKKVTMILKPVIYAPIHLRRSVL